MKMFKKFVAVMMAAVLSMALLTACGGGSGSGPSSKLAGILGSGKVYISYIDEDGEKAIEAYDGNTFYVEEVDSKIWVKGNVLYLLNEDGEGQKMTLSDADLAEMKASPLYGGVKNVKIENNYKVTINGVEKTYYAEILESATEKLIFCFDGNKPVYAVSIDEDNEKSIIQILELKGEIPAGLMDLPSDVEFE